MDVLRTKGVELISLVADIDGAVVGHILFSAVSLSGQSHLKVMGLGPMAVTPLQQRRGIGSALIWEGLSRCQDLGCHAVVVLGHAEYYPRFGFVPAAEYAIRFEYDVPEEAFMVAELETGALQGISGLIRYDQAFANV